ncbi:beta-ketoacyl-[acyl-carrier-protein] synthase family protein [Pelosinus baikalensis]|uniref:Nodulation protein E n=1 Tax=Pelosinus baikalensis TaxID=2892015 RepID=A0ABS8HVF8_9FIRM|nr:beta-ketoacyl-[acyl-carrier-protein] synthase family protein [Pelosinus baikalensis]MCC5466499.1 beta-ketoacyl-[acyl-carrier-protein] synthase family protein [Pelosinus baikalensis]
MDTVVITGIGVISSAGLNLEDFWNTLAAGKVSYGEIEEYKDNKNYRVKIGAKIDDERWNRNVSEEIRVKYGRTSNYAVSATLSALESAGLSSEMLPNGRTAISIGTTMGEIQVEERISEIRHEKGVQGIPKTLLRQYRTDNIASSIRAAIGVSGPIYNVPTACAAGNYAIALGKRLIDWGCADVVIAGGVDVFSRVAFTGFQRLLSLTPDMCRPFDRNRKGLVIGEGCGIVILERASSAKARGARIFGEIIGVGLTSDRHHMISPHPEGDGAVRAMQLALEEARILPGEIDYVSAHGTGTPANDKVEAKALSRVFGPERIPPTSSIKSMIGHAMGAASALELVASLQMMNHGCILPTINYETPDPECMLDCVPNKARKAPINCVISNSFAFGGQIGSIIVKKG